MTDATFEAKKDTLRQTQDGLWKLTLTVKPDDMPDWLLRAPPGQRIGAAALHEIGDDERPIEQPKSEGEKAVQLAGVLAKDPEFQLWLRQQSGWPVDGVTLSDEDYAAACIRHHCGVVSRSHLALHYEARKRFKDMVFEFRHKDTKR